MLLRVVKKIYNNHGFSSASYRFLSHSIPRYENSKVTEDTSEKTEVIGENRIQMKKTVYPERRLKARVTNHLHVPEEHPWDRVKKAFRYDYMSAKAFFAGKPPPPVQEASDILIVGGGIVGSSIAYHITQRTGVGVNIVVLEKDPPVSIFH